MGLWERGQYETLEQVSVLQKVQTTMMRQEYACEARQCLPHCATSGRVAWHTDSMEQRCMRRAMALLRQNQSRIPARTKLLTQPHITASLSKRNHRNSRTTSPCDFGRLTQRTCTGRTGRAMHASCNGPPEANLKSDTDPGESETYSKASSQQSSLNINKARIPAQRLEPAWFRHETTAAPNSVFRIELPPERRIA